MEFWPEFLASSWGMEFAAGGVGGMAGVVSGYPLDTLRIRLQQPSSSSSVKSANNSAFGLLKNIVSNEGVSALYRGMSAPLASVAFQNAVAFQVYAVLTRALDPNSPPKPPSYQNVTLAGIGTGALQSLILSPVELVKIRLQLQTSNKNQHQKTEGPLQIAKKIIRTEGIRGLYRGLAITTLRDAPAHGVYFWSYEYAREKLHPGCRESGQESLRTMLLAGGLAGVASWVCCYPLDVVKSRLQAETGNDKYKGILDCFCKSAREEGYSVFWRGLGTAVTRAFVVNGAIFTAYELALRFLVSNGNDDAARRIMLDEN